MKCRMCGRNPATTHIKTLVNGAVGEYSLCAECARRLGYRNLFADLSRGLELLGMQENVRPQTAEQCVCGATFQDIVRTGKVGCAECYRTFYHQLIPVIRKLHGETVHRGKTPGGALPQMRQQKELMAQKKELLQRAIELENFEEAAVLRDEIRQLEGGQKDGRQGKMV